MNYTALIENRRSVREFTGEKVAESTLAQIKLYYYEQCRRLDPALKTALLIFGSEAQEKLEGTAGYNQFLIGAPTYLVLLSEQGPLAGLNAGYMMQDISLKLEDMNLGSCWITFTDSDAVKKALCIESRLNVVAILAFGHGKKAPMRPRINILSMANIDIFAKRRYMDPKKQIGEMVFLHSWGNRHGVEDYIGFFDDMLWEALHAASLAPSYLNRQAYGFLLHDDQISLVSTPDAYNVPHDADLSLGIVLLHFDAVAEKWAGKVQWRFGDQAASLQLPPDCRVIASRAL